MLDTKEMRKDTLQRYLYEKLLEDGYLSNIEVVKGKKRRRTTRLAAVMNTLRNKYGIMTKSVVYRTDNKGYYVDCYYYLVGNPKGKKKEAIMGAIYKNKVEREC